MAPGTTSPDTLPWSPAATAGSGWGWPRTAQCRSGGGDLGHQPRQQRRRPRRADRRRFRAAVAAFGVDVADEESVAAGTAQTLETFGRIDSLFANAGVSGRPAPIDEMSTEEWRRVMSVNLDGQFYTVRSVAGHMKARRSGSIVFTSSVSMSEGLPFSTHYAAAKAALTAHGPRSCRRTGTRGHPRQRDRAGLDPGGHDRGPTVLPAAQAKILPRVPLRRWGAPDDYEALAVWLAGPGRATSPVRPWSSTEATAFSALRGHRYSPARNATRAGAAGLSVDGSSLTAVGGNGGDGGPVSGGVGGSGGLAFAPNGTATPGTPGTST